MIASGLSGCLGKGCAWSFAGGLKRPLSILGITRAIVSGPDWQRARRRRGYRAGKFDSKRNTHQTRCSLATSQMRNCSQTMLPGGCFEAMMFRSKCRVDLLSAGASGCGKPVGRQEEGGETQLLDARRSDPVAYRTLIKG